MIDIHSHILPAIDDGSSDIETSLVMASIAKEDGIEGIIATPHIKSDQFLLEQIDLKIAELNTEIKKKGIDVKIYRGGEIPIELSEDKKCLITLAESSYILIELPFSHIPEESSKLLDRLLKSGFSPIIAHPERNYEIIKDPYKLLKLLKPGIHMQLTAGSLRGDFGKKTCQCSKYLVKKRVVDFIASDAHDTIHRRPELSYLYKKNKLFSPSKQLNRILKINPRKIIENQPLQ